MLSVTTLRVQRIAATAAVTTLAATFGLAFAATTAGAVAANTMYMTDFQSNSGVYTINTTTGAATKLGLAGVQLTDLAFRNSTLFGVSFSTLFKVNPSTGHATAVGALGFNDINSLAVQPSTGTVFAMGNAGEVVRISPSTGRATKVGTLGTGLSSAGDLEFVNGVMYASVDRSGYNASWLAKVNLSTGHATLVGSTGRAGVWGLALDHGKLYGATRSGCIVTINVSTGRATKVGCNARQQAGLTTFA